MPYLGNEPAVAYTSTTKDSFSGDASTTDFTMSKSANVNAVRVVVENVVQDPTVAYTCSGTTLSFTSAPPTGTNNIYVVHLGPPAATVAPPTTINNNTTFTGGVSLKNETPEDTDGGRESKVTFKGLQSGQEESTLAEIQASHDGTADDEKGDLIFRTNDGSDGSSPTEAARIDSGQNLLVGTTDINPGFSDTNTGSAIRSAGSIFTSVSGSTAGYFNRNTNDGDIISFRKDGAAVGSIGTVATALYLANSDTGLQFYGGGATDQIVPSNGSGATRDNAIDLGKSTGRFKDLYLSGGAYIGGTVAANKLDDFEQGTFTPRLRGGTEPASLVTGVGRYTKIGDFVHIYFTFENVNTTGYSGGISFDQMPFTNGPTRTVGTIATFNAATWTDHPILEVIGSSTTVGMQNTRSGNSWLSATHSAGNVRYFWGAYAFRQN